MYKSEKTQNFKHSVNPEGKIAHVVLKHSVTLSIRYFPIMDSHFLYIKQPNTNPSPNPNLNPRD